ncbi:hypothetical protein AB0G15_05350 [Streptosporangium sp. NPDC023825]|uniref:hypothetical protein n=1 Tax=Streptosporangium sp. NPDC023825 TaxID=3154909 RepID=UPI00343AD2B9
MATLSDVIARVRMELGDQAEDFVRPDIGGRQVIELGVRNVDPDSLTVVITEPQLPGEVVDPSRYTVTERSGILTLLDVPSELATVVITGSHYPVWTDAEITRFVNDALAQHLYEVETVERYKDEVGHIRYERGPKTLADLGAVEIVPVTILAAIEALWSAATDAATDINVVTSEGTHIQRGQRYEQIMTHLEALTRRYKQICQQMGIGLYRVQMDTLRRISLQTGRLVPVFTPREYDEWDLPRRRLPPVDSPHEDESGIPSPIYGAWGV